MARTVGDFFWDRLYQWGVRRVFGYPGDGINGLLGALNRFGEDKIRFIQVRHEEMAAFMAAAHAKFTGELGVCIATSGPGASHLITGLYDPASTTCRCSPSPDSRPAPPSAATISRKSMSSACSRTSPAPSSNRPPPPRRCVTSWIAPSASPRANGTSPPSSCRTTFRTCRTRNPRASTARCTPASATPRPKSFHTKPNLRRAADVLNAGKKVAILVGAGALQATDEVIAVANRLGAGAAKALLGKAALPDDLPWVIGSIGLLGTKPSWDLMTGCDTLLMIGSGFPYSEFMPKEGQASGVQIDLKPDMLSLRYPMEVNLVGDSAETLRALLPLLDEQSDRSWRTTVETNVASWWKQAEARAMQSAAPVNPQRVVWELSKRVPERAIVTSDSGSCANWYARDLKVRRGMMCSLSGGLASMGAAVPYAIAAKFAHPDRPVVALVGDGAMQMNNMAELITVQKYWREWSNKTWICCVFNNQDLNQVTWEQRVMEGDPKFNATQQIPDVPYHRFAELIGLRGIFVDHPDALAGAWEEALYSDRPVVLEVRTDPNVPPLPSHITLEQAKAFTSTLVKGDPEEGSMIVNTAKEVLGGILPGRRS